jgi:lysozyme family protein
MSGLFGRAVELVLKHEGGYVNNPKDPGGETKYGISKRQHPDVNIKGLSISQAQAIYLEHYWKPHRFDELNSELLAIKAFDLAVNCSPNRVIRWLQRSANAEGTALVVDGVMGNKTIEALNQISAERLLVRMMEYAYRHYSYLGERMPEFFAGWIARLWSI